MKTLMLVPLLIGASLQAQPDWKQRADALQKDSSLLAAEGEKEAALFKAGSLTLKQKRLEDLAAQHGIQKEKVAEGEREKKLALASVKEAEQKIALAKLDKAGSEAPEARIRIRRELAAIAVDKAEAELKLAQFKYDGFAALVGGTAVDPGVLAEAELTLRARQTEVKTAKAVLQLVENALQP